MRVMREMIISTDDIIPVRISYPSELTREELDDLKDTIAIWIRGLERQVKPTPKPPDAVAESCSSTEVGENGTVEERRGWASRLTS